MDHKNTNTVPKLIHVVLYTTLEQSKKKIYLYIHIYHMTSSQFSIY